MDTVTEALIEPVQNAGATLPEQLQLLRKNFESGSTKTFEWRRSKLLRLRELVLAHEADIYSALYKDLHKSKEEAWATEIGILLTEINHAIKNLRKWMRRKRVGTNLVNLPSSSFIYAEPKGVVLIIGPWNYPLMLVMGPLVGALAAGNTVVLKPSEYAPATAGILQRMIRLGFSESEILVVEGDGAKLVPAMMQNFAFDHVFFTGGTAVGKMVYEMAASKLVPVTLELGGKSPCIIEADANLPVAAKRIALTKFSNAGQMCIAPDYLLVHAAVKDEFLRLLTSTLDSFFSSNASASESYGRIVNERQFNRLVNYLKEGRILYGGQSNAGEKYLAPTIMDQIEPGSSILKEEIFGPILPVISFTHQQEVLDLIARNPNPLAFYVFTNSHSKEEEWISKVGFGSGCVNNASWHFANPKLPFGGRGNSGTGAAHGKFSFDTFTHYKAVMKTPTWFDPALKYPPFKGKLALFKKLIS